MARADAWWRTLDVRFVPRERRESTKATRAAAAKVLAKAASREDLAGAVIAETPRVLCGVALSFDGDSAYYLPLPAPPPPWSFDDGDASRASQGERARPTAPRQEGGARPAAAAIDEPSVSSRVVGFAYGEGAFRWLATLSTEEDERRARGLRGLRERDDARARRSARARALDRLARVAPRRAPRARRRLGAQRARQPVGARHRRVARPTGSPASTRGRASGRHGRRERACDAVDAAARGAATRRSSSRTTRSR